MIVWLLDPTIGWSKELHPEPRRYNTNKMENDLPTLSTIVDERFSWSQSLHISAYTLRICLGLVIKVGFQRHAERSAALRPNWVTELVLDLHVVAENVNETLRERAFTFKASGRNFQRSGRISRWSFSWSFSFWQNRRVAWRRNLQTRYHWKGFYNLDQVPCSCTVDDASAQVVPKTLSVESRRLVFVAKASLFLCFFGQEERQYFCHFGCTAVICSYRTSTEVLSGVD